jgi:hypothetical protein
MNTVVVAGALANKPGNGGEAWVRLSWVQALQSLGFDVLFLEQISPDALVGDVNGGFEGSTNVKYFDEVTRAFGLEGRAALILGEGDRTHGLTWEEIGSLMTDARLLVNIGGHLTLRELKDRVKTRAYVDIDPGFTQIWAASGVTGAQLEDHDHYFTIGTRIGSRECRVPTLGLRWKPIRQPVLLEEWPTIRGSDPERFTTVASWRGAYGPLEFEGRTFGLKVHQFRRFMGLPERAPGRFEIALAIHPGDRRDLESLHRNGWTITDPGEACATPETFRSYVQGSGGEFSVAQGVYVETACGWFSDRSVRYLASGKPVLVQDTGLEGTLPLGEGLVVFRTMDEAVDGARQILADYAHHARAARTLATEYFAPEPALEPLLEATGVTP